MSVNRKTPLMRLSSVSQEHALLLFSSLIALFGMPVTNISPQVGKGFNRNYWFYFEEFVRSLTTNFDDVYVITGPLYLPKIQEDGRYYVKYEVIGDPPNTAVPTHFYKGDMCHC